MIRSESGQLVLLSQQALAQTQQGPARVSAPPPRAAAPQVCVGCVRWRLSAAEGPPHLFVLSGTQASAAAAKGSEKVVAPPAPSSLQPAPAQQRVAKVAGWFRAPGL